MGIGSVDLVGVVGDVHGFYLKDIKPELLISDFYDVAEFL